MDVRSTRVDIQGYTFMRMVIPERSGGSLAGMAAGGLWAFEDEADTYIHLTLV